MRRGSRKDDSPRQARVTARESEILGWVAVGKSDWAIGRLLRISGKTVNFHVENAKRKFGVGMRTDEIAQGNQWAPGP